MEQMEMKNTVVYAAKSVKLAVVAALALGMSAGLANAQAFHTSESNSVQMNLTSISDLVRSCVVQPYSIKADGTKVYAPLKSHCLYVTLINESQAQIQFDRHLYQAQITESRDSDADFYDVLITDLTTNDQMTIPEVLAYGDVLLGVLKGDTHDIPEVLIGGDQPIISPAQQ
jgi:hypothetical protein